MSIEKLLSCLPLEKYGIPPAKSIDQLLGEINKGECRIVWEGNKPVRELRVVRIKVRCGKEELWEKIQYYPSGEHRIRNIRGISEKLIGDEPHGKGARRALREELGLDEELDLLWVGKGIKENYSDSYPDLLCRYEFYDYEVEIPISMKKKEYVEECEDGMRTFFEWKCIDEGM